MYVVFINFIRFVTPVLLLVTAPVAAQTLTDSLTPFDTVGIVQRRTLFTPDQYSFHAATRLAGLQVLPVLLRSSDSTVHRQALRARRRYSLPGPLGLIGCGLIFGSIGANPIRNPELSGTLALGGMATITAGLIISLTAPGTMRRAIQRHNLVMTTDNFAYVRPVTLLTGTDFELNRADTVTIKQQLLATKYIYRGIQVVPDLQLQAALQSIKDPLITEGLRQNRIFRGIGGVVGGVSASVLSTYFLARLLVQASGGRVRSTNPFVYYALGGVAASFTIGRLSDKTTRQMVRRYNEQLSNK